MVGRSRSDEGGEAARHAGPSGQSMVTFAGTGHPLGSPDGAAVTLAPSNRSGERPDGPASARHASLVDPHRLGPVGAVGLLVATLLRPSGRSLSPPPAAASSPFDPVRFDTTWTPSGGNSPANQHCPSGTYTVPAGTNLVRITAVGGVGMGGSDLSVDPTGHISFLGTNGGGNGGQAARVSGILAVTPGQVLNVVVATDAAKPESATRILAPPAGGWGGGGKAGNVGAPVSGGGGGASYVTTAALIDDIAAGTGGKDIDDPSATGCKPATVWQNPDLDMSSSMLIVAGGGGGGGNATSFHEAARAATPASVAVARPGPAARLRAGAAAARAAPRHTAAPRATSATTTSCASARPGPAATFSRAAGTMATRSAQTPAAGKRALGRRLRREELHQRRQWRRRRRLELHQASGAVPRASLTTRQRRSSRSKPSRTRRRRS